MLDFITFTAGEKTVMVSFNYSIIRGITPQSVEVCTVQDDEPHFCDKVPITVINTTPAIHKRIAGTVSILARRCRLCVLRLLTGKKKKSQLEREISKLHIRYLILCISVLLLTLGGIRLTFTVRTIVRSIASSTEKIDLIRERVEDINQVIQNAINS